MTPEEAATDAEALYLQIFTKSTMAEIVELIAAALLEAAKPKWQPMETAPKDGSHVLLYDADHWDFDKRVIAFYDKGEWRDLGSYGTELEGVTQWVALPEPPPSADKTEAP